MTLATFSSANYSQPQRWEYAGFWYIIRRVDGHLSAEPEPGQHRAAGKEKHRRAAVDTYIEQKSDG